MFKIFKDILGMSTECQKQFTRSAGNVLSFFYDGRLRLSMCDKVCISCGFPLDVNATADSPHTRVSVPTRGSKIPGRYMYNMLVEIVFCSNMLILKQTCSSCALGGSWTV